MPGLFADPVDPLAGRVSALLMGVEGVEAVEIRRGQGATILLKSKTAPTAEQLRAIAEALRAGAPAAPEQPATAGTSFAGLLSLQNVLLVVFVPLALVLDRNGAPPLLTFIAAGVCLIPLAGLIEKATESLSRAFGPTVGALLNSSLGNLPELIISITALQKGLDSVVKATIIGTVIGNLLLSLGAAMFLGGFRRPSLKFNTLSAGVSGNLLFLAVVAIQVPILFDLANNKAERAISREIAGVLLVLYGLSLVFSLVTHKRFLGTAKEGHEELASTGAQWSVAVALLVLSATAGVLALVSDVLTTALTPAAQNMGLSDFFAGMFLLAAASNVPQLLNVVSFARKGDMELAFNVTLQSCTQMLVFVGPLLVFISYFLGGGMDLVFSPFAASALVLTVLAIRGLLTDGETNWMEGAFLLGLYVLLGIGVFYLPAK
jgi:Ca2+:H+ antiporter